MGGCVWICFAGAAFTTFGLIGEKDAITYHQSASIIRNASAETVSPIGIVGDVIQASPAAHNAVGAEQAIEQVDRAAVIVKAAAEAGIARSAILFRMRPGLPNDDTIISPVRPRRAAIGNDQVLQRQRDIGRHLKHAHLVVPAEGDIVSAGVQYGVLADGQRVRQHDGAVAGEGDRAAAAQGGAQGGFVGGGYRGCRQRGKRVKKRGDKTDE